MVRRLFAAVAMLGMLGAPMVPAGAQSGDGQPASLLERLIDTADESLGEDSTVGVLRAYDRGHDLVQVLTALLGGWLAADGTITDEDGAPVEPARAAAGVIVEAGGTAGSALGGPVGGRSRRAGPTSGEEIGLDVLERGIQKTTKQLDKEADLGARADDYDVEANVFTMLTVISLMDQGYSPEQIIIDGFIEKRIHIDFANDRMVIRDEKGKVLRPELADPLADADPETAAQVDTLVDDVFDAISGEDPLAAADDTFKRQYTLTIDMDITDSEGFSGAVEGKVNFGARKGEPGALSGRGTGTFTGKGACSLSELDTTKYPYSVEAPLRIGVAGKETDGKATLAFGLAATGSVQVDAEGDSLCLGIVRDTADAYPSLLSIPDVEVRLKDGAQANADNQDSGQPFTVGVAVHVKEI